MRLLLTILLIIVLVISLNAQRGVMYQVYYIDKASGDAELGETVVYGRTLSAAEEKRLKGHFIYAKGRDFRKKYKTCIHKTILL